MEREVFEAMLSASITAATNAAKADFQVKIDELTQQIKGLQTPTPIVKFEPISIDSQVSCNETLDLVKSLPEFNGDSARYVSWRQAVFAAHTVFENFTGSSKYYQAVAIIRNKVVGSADSVLSSFNTVLNFHAIIARLDFTYSDKRPIHVLEQQMSLLRQGSMHLNEFYDEVEKKLSAIINKIIMTNSRNGDLTSSLCEKYRSDALRVFISGLRKPMCDILFAARPTDLPSALALAQELECNRARLNMASINFTPSPYNYKNSQQYNGHQNMQSNQNSFQQPTPMEVDPSSSRFNRNPNVGNQNRAQQTFRQHPLSNSNARNQFRAQGSPQQVLASNSNSRMRVGDRYVSNGFPNNQRINYVDDDQFSLYDLDGQEPIRNSEEVSAREEKNSSLPQNLDAVNFFGAGPSCHT